MDTLVKIYGELALIWTPEMWPQDTLIGPKGGRIGGCPLYILTWFLSHIQLSLVPSDLEIRALKIYSPNGPRNGVVIIFLTQSSKSLWLSKISETISLCSPDPVFPASPSPPLHHSASSSTITPPSSPTQNGRSRSLMRRVSVPTSGGGGGGGGGGSGSPTSRTPNGHTTSNGNISSYTSCHKHEETSMRNSPILVNRASSLFSFDTDGKPSPETRYEQSNPRHAVCMYVCVDFRSKHV